MLCTTFVALGVVCGPNRSNKFSLKLFCCVPHCGLRGGVLGCHRLMYGQVRQSTLHAARLRSLPHAPRAARRQMSLCYSCPSLLIAAHRRTSPHIAAHRRTSLHIAARRNVAARCNVVTRRFTMSPCMSPHVAACRLPPFPHVAACRHMLLYDAA
jgi:hypothetical protein